MIITGGLRTIKDWILIEQMEINGYHIVLVIISGYSCLIRNWGIPNGNIMITFSLETIKYTSNKRLY